MTTACIDYYGENLKRKGKKTWWARAHMGQAGRRCSAAGRWARLSSWVDKSSVGPPYQPRAPPPPLIHVLSTVQYGTKKRGIVITCSKKMRNGFRIGGAHLVVTFPAHPFQSFHVGRHHLTWTMLY